MPRPLAALLILLVALTSIGLGTARGTVRLGDEVVLCTGHGIVVTRLPAGEGGPRAHLCPDMALTLLAGMAGPAAALPPPPPVPQADPPPQHHPAALGPLQLPQARGPPVPRAASLS